MALSDRDRAFLHEYLQFGYMHHIVAAEALRSAYERADETAGAMREQVERTDRLTATELATTLNDGARVQTVVVARLLSELAAAIEDLGALIHGIRQRTRRGVMVEYLEAGVSAASAALDRLLTEAGANLPTLLKLPDLAALRDQIDSQALPALEHDYASLAGHLTAIASIYRAKGSGGVVTEASSVPGDQVAIVLGMAEGGDDNRRRGGLLAQAHNKVKHRFAVIEDIAAMGRVAGPSLLYAHYPRHQAGVMVLVNNITQVCLAGGELAALMLTLDRSDGLEPRTVGGESRSRVTT